MFSERTRSCLLDIVEDADLPIGFINGVDADTLARDKRTLLAVERLFQRITEADVKIGSDDMLKVGSGIPVTRIRAFGNRLRHDDRAIDPHMLLMTARDDLPSLRDAALRALEA